MVSHPRARDLLDWYDRHRRDLPWRAPPGVRPDPYRVWLSEIMLQQTTVEAVRPRFDRFLARWPDLASLAAATLDGVLDHWAGLGYYARARNLHACARKLVDEHGGRFPDSPQALAGLPGIGPYTAAAIAAIAFDRPVAAVDGNVERVISRLYRISTPLPAAKAEIHARAESLVPSRRPGDFAQAMMDLGSLVCSPRAPACAACPWTRSCAAAAAGDLERFPVKATKAPRPTRRAMAFWLVCGEEVLLRRRPAHGLLGGMLELPSSPWEEVRALDLAAALGHAPVVADWQVHMPAVSHVFTHFRLELAIAAARVGRERRIAGLWTPLSRVEAGLPTVMRKAARFAAACLG